MSATQLSEHQADEFMKKVNQLTKLGYKKTRLRPPVKTLLECLAYQALIVDRNTKSFLTYTRLSLMQKGTMHEIEQGLSTLQKMGLIQYQAFDNGVQYSLNIEQIEKLAKE